MAVLDATPNVIDVEAYAGDTLVIRVLAPAEVTDGKEWAAQIKEMRGGTVDATFIVTPPPVSGEPAILTLSAAETRRLASNGYVTTATKNVKGAASRNVVVQRYSGQWDVQVSGPGGVDPVTTLAQGGLTIDLDVTDPP